MAKNICYVNYNIEERLATLVYSWEECLALNAKGKSRYKGFTKIEDAKAWIYEDCPYLPNEERRNKLKEKKELLPTLKAQLDIHGVYVDSGVGRKRGVEVNVTDVYGNSLINEYELKEIKNICEHEICSIFNTVLLGTKKTNNYGELLALYLGVKIAMTNNLNNVYSDSNLIIEYWSKGICSKDLLPPETLTLIDKMKHLRGIFELYGGTIHKISGDINVADLGFHKMK